MSQAIPQIILTKQQKRELKKLGVLLLYLYGSYATGYYHKESDIDVAALLSKKQEEKARESIEEELKVIGQIDEVLSNQLPNKIDNFFIDHDIKIINDFTPLLKMRVLTDGILLYKRNNFYRIQFQLQTVRDYEDWQHLAKIKYHYLI